MTDESCFTALEEYAQELISKPLLPSALFWSSPGCRGIRYPQNVQQDQIGQPVAGGCVSLSEALQGNIRSLFVPENVTVELYQSSSCDPLNAHGFVRSMLQVSSGTQVLIPDTNQLMYANGSSVDTSSASARIRFNTSSPNFVSEDATKLFLCQNRNFTLSGIPYQGYTPASALCDDFVRSYCQKDNNMSQPACNCIRDQKELDEAFPNNYIPASCAGGNCVVTGYRDNHAANIPCDTTMCDSIIEQYGSNLSSESNTVIYCGSQPFNAPGLNSVAPSVSPTPASFGDTGPALKTWQWGAIVAGAAVLTVLLGFGLAYRARQQEINKTKTRN